jgi:hypothetical protein
VRAFQVSKSILEVCISAIKGSATVLTIASGITTRAANRAAAAYIATSSCRRKAPMMFDGVFSLVQNGDRFAAVECVNAPAL